jgi:hypothetical protein
VRRAGDPPLCPVPDPPPTPPDTDPSDEEDPEGSGKPYLISGKKGVGETEFKALTILPPLDKKQGDIISFPDSPWVSFQVLDLSEKDAALLRLNPLIEFVVEITEDEGEQRAVPRRDTSLLKRVTSWVKRALPSALSVRLNAGYHLKLLSARNQRLNPTVLPDYTFQPSLGEGQTIYVLDSGYQTLHEVSRVFFYGRSCSN